MCGEKEAVTARRYTPRGSPPRVRGKGAQKPGVHPVRGITPACAGKSNVYALWKKATLGSPPRVRGKESCRLHRHKHSRITPACAGKRKSLQLQFAILKDHPRVCVEKLLSALSARAVVGSPPRVRGKAETYNRREVWKRITPACAGKRNNDYSNRARHWDHPRVCGEKTKKIP